MLIHVAAGPFMGESSGLLIAIGLLPYPLAVAGLIAGPVIAARRTGGR